MKSQVVIDAFLTIAAALSGDSGYRWMPPVKEPLYLSRHPFEPDFEGQVLWSGFSSDDFRSMLRFALKPSEGFISDPENLHLILWFVLADEIEFHEDRSKYDSEPRYNILAEIRNDYQSVMCDGMTNYSGSGGAAFFEIEAVFTFLGVVLEALIETKFLPYGAEQLAEDLANQAYEGMKGDY